MQSKKFEVSYYAYMKIQMLTASDFLNSPFTSFTLADSVDPYKSSGKERKLGLVVARGTSVMTIAPVEGTEEISNPFAQGENRID